MTGNSPGREGKEAWSDACSNGRTREALKCSVSVKKVKSLTADNILAHTVLSNQCLLLDLLCIYSSSFCLYFIILNSGAVIPGRTNLISFSSVAVFFQC